MVTLYRAIMILIDFIELLIVVRILLSFLNIRGRKGILTRVVYDMTEPVLAPARNLISIIGINTGMFDFSPIISVLFLRLISSFIRTRLL